MAQIVSSETIEGVHVITPDVYGDDRGFFVETYRREWIPDGSQKWSKRTVGIVKVVA